MAVIVKQQPIQTLLEVPLDHLSELASHEVQLFAGVREHISEESAQGSKLLLHAPAAHLVKQRSLSVYYLVVGNGEYIVFAEAVEE